jgi:lipopolysaccharide biosynthesis regulator YciM
MEQQKKMDEHSVEDFKADIPLLIQTGFIAVKQLDETSARRIFHAAHVLSPESTAPQIGIGYIALNKVELKEASTIFEEVLQKEPDNHLAQSFLAICYLLSKTKRAKGETMIREAMEKTTDPTVKHLGKVVLEWLEKDLKKNSKPFSE